MRREGEGYNPNLPLGQWLVSQHLALKFIKAGVSLDVVFPPHSGSVGPLLLRVTAPQRQFRVSSLEDLKGFVHIEHPQAALQFVRLRTSTSYSYEGVWTQDINEVETHQQEEAIDGLESGKASPSSPDIDESSGMEYPDSGLYAVLSSRAYRAGQFQPASVQTVKGRYQVIRWVCLFSGVSEVRVQKWRETVSPDGAYSREILTDKPAPQLPDTHWVLWDARNN